ncbi:MAG TPA: DUF2934 domain-containing protein [Steroidobacteraceae bacterium]|jgi:hypothetical protein|nr:DUF2934 domain-containing protein [Steroidobacteraceae bacterium]
MAATLVAKRAPARIPDVPADLPHVLAMCIAPHIHEDRNACIAESAYFIAQRRGFVPGHELEDWLRAESEVDARLSGEGCAF